VSERIRCYCLLREGTPSELPCPPIPVITVHRVTSPLARAAADRLGREIQGHPYQVQAIASDCDCRGRMVLEDA